MCWLCTHQDAYREAVQELQRRERGILAGASSRRLADIEVCVLRGLHRNAVILEGTLGSGTQVDPVPLDVRHACESTALRYC